MQSRIRFAAFACLAMAIPALAHAAPPPPPTLIEPSGSAPISPLYRWNASPGATTYELLVQNTQGVAGDFTIPASTYCGGTTCSVIPYVSACGAPFCPYVDSGSTYAWFVRASNAEGASAWSAGNTIFVQGPPTLVSPVNSATPATPTFVWKTVDAPPYQAFVGDALGSTIITGTTLSSTSACVRDTNDALYSCSFTQAAPLASGTPYSWWVTNAIGQSALASFTVAGSLAVPAPPVILQPAPGGSATMLPTYIWQASVGATLYYLQVQNLEGAPVSLSVAPSAAGCVTGGICIYTASVPLAWGKSYNVFVRASNSSGTSDWSAPNMFMVLIGGTASLVSPTGTLATPTPTFVWTSPLPGPYELDVQVPAGLTYFDQLVSPSCTFSSQTYRCSYTLPVGLPAGNTYAWQVGNAAGFSNAFQFSLPAPSGSGPTMPPGTPILVSPSGFVGPSMSFIWNPDPGTAEYDLLVQNTAGVAVMRTVNASDVCGTVGVDCDLDLAPALTPGAAYNWFVRARNSVGTSSWSSPLTIFTASAGLPSAPTLVAPQGSVPPSPTFTWNAVAGASRYSLLVQNTSGVWGSLDIDAAAAGCSSGLGACTASTSFGLPPHSMFSWFVKAFAPGGESTWGGPMAISTP